tara:strand:- start:123 stop:995 length:873 start_codon:yes stop_codon:yes gene_type:complete
MNKNKKVFEIKKLNCSYQRSLRPVLEIDDLEIIQGTTTFFLGGSGVGKSTILESLGLMNNTIQQNKGSVLNFYYQNHKKSYFELWSESEKTLSNFRRDHFNFIFQSNNLFNSLDAYQNIMIPALLAGRDEETAKQHTISILQKILEDVKTGTNEKINILKLSGGQRQRLSFARAMASYFDVLFADEPTGNLDYDNAHKIMDFLENEKPADSTVVIVSHDIELAVSKADHIVFIDRKRDNNFNPPVLWGKITKESMYRKEKNQWHDPDNKKITTSNLIKVLRKRLKEISDE